MPKGSNTGSEGLRDALEAARARAPVPFPDDVEWPVTPRPGEFRVAMPMDRAPGERARIVLIFEVEPAGDPWVNAFLVAEAIDVATAADVRLEPHETKLPFPALVETDVVGPLFFAQLGPPLGGVGEELLAQLVRVSAGEMDLEIEHRRGLPVFGRRDARWGWKERELAEMHVLAYPCMRVDLTAPSPVMLVDPHAMTWIGRSAPRTETLRRLLRVMSSAGDRGPTALELVGATVSDIATVTEGLAPLGPDAWRAVEPVLTGALRGSAGPSRRVRWRPPLSTRGLEAIERRIAEKAASGARSVRVLTRPPGGGLPSDVTASALAVELPAVHALEIEGIGLVQVKAEVLEEDAA